MSGKVSAEERMTWPLSKVVTEIKKSIRTDYGGASGYSEQVNRIVSRIRKYPECNGLGEQELHIIAKVVHRENSNLRNGIAQRVKNHTDEIERRFGGY